MSLLSGTPALQGWIDSDGANAWTSPCLHFARMIAAIAAVFEQAERNYLRIPPDLLDWSRELPNPDVFKTGIDTSLPIQR